MNLSEDAVKDYLRQIGGTALLTAADEYTLGARIEAGVLARQRLAEAASAGIEFDAAARRELQCTVADGLRAKDHMVRANLRLVVSIAKRYPTPTGISMLDLVQEGTVGLMHAVDKFDHRRGLKLSTYATWWIKQSIGRALGEQSHTIRLPAHVVEVLNRVLRTRRALSQRLGREASIEELAAEVELTVEQVRTTLGRAREPISLHTPIGEDGDGGELGGLIADPAPDPSVLVTDGALRGQLDRVLATLPEREAQVIALRFGLDGTQARTLEEVGRLFGVSRARVRQIEAKAMRKLRQPTRTRALEGMLN